MQGDIAYPYTAEGQLAAANGTHHTGAQLVASAYGQNAFYGNNFNSLPRALVTLFELLVVNNWNVTVEGFALTSGGAVWCYLYFISFYFAGVVITTNIVIAFVVDCFVPGEPLTNRIHLQGKFVAVRWPAVQQ